MDHFSNYELHHYLIYTECLYVMSYVGCLKDGKLLQ